jgi:hypothetical protein
VYGGKADLPVEVVHGLPGRLPRSGARLRTLACRQGRRAAETGADWGQRSQLAAARARGATVFGGRCGLIGRLLGGDFRCRYG